MAEHALRTQADVHRLPKPKAGEAVYFDEGKPRDRANGLALRIREAGSRKFVFFYRHGRRQFKYTIGNASNWTLDKARVEARKLRTMVDHRQNPAAERRKQESDTADAKTFKELADKYLAARHPDMKPRYHEECSRHLEKDWKPFHKHPVHEITSDMVADQLKKIEADSGPAARNRARSTLSRFFAWIIGERHSKLVRTNPVSGTGKVKEVGSRERVLSDAELAAIWNAAPDNDYGRIVRLLMLTAQRRDEVGGLHWGEVDRKAKLIALPGSRTKNRRSHDVPLSDMALTVLDAVTERDGRALVFGNGDGGYSGWSKSKEALDEAAKVTDWTLHDLRRTAATRMADLGVAPHVIEAILNHISGHKAGVAGIYNRSTYAAEKRAALDLWASHLQVVIAKASGANVTTLRSA